MAAMYSTPLDLLPNIDISDKEGLLLQTYSSKIHNTIRQQQPWNHHHHQDSLLTEDSFTDEDIPDLTHCDSRSVCSTVSLCSVAHSSASSLSTNAFNVSSYESGTRNTSTHGTTTSLNLDASSNNCDSILSSLFSLDSDLSSLLQSSYSPIKDSNTDYLSFKSIQAEFLQLSHPSTLIPIVSLLSQTMKDSLNDTQSPTMLPSLLTSLPSGREKGTFLSVDVGGSTLRVALIKLSGRTSTTLQALLHSKHYRITDSLKNSSGYDFFMWICEKIKSATEFIGIQSKLYMGLSWSFPFSQLEDISKGTILTMGKGYKVADEIVGWELNDTFSKCFQTLGLDIELTAIINDTIASLVSHSYFSENTRAALILGTGVNASAILPVTKNGKVTQALVNTELSLLGGNIIPETKWDRTVDSEVERPGFQPFETKVSGRYLGEISRLVIKDVFDNKFDLFCGFEEKYGFDTEIMSKAEGYFLQGDLKKSREVLEESTGYEFQSDQEVEEVCRIFQSVSSRSAAYAATYLLALTNNIETTLPNETISIAYSGTVVEKYPMYKERCQKFLDAFARLSGLDTKYKLEPALDGTLYGPAIASAMNL